MSLSKVLVFSVGVTFLWINDYLIDTHILVAPRCLLCLLYKPGHPHKGETKSINCFSSPPPPPKKKKKKKKHRFYAYLSPYSRSIYHLKYQEHTWPFTYQYLPSKPGSGMNMEGPLKTWVINSMANNYFCIFTIHNITVWNITIPLWSFVYDIN